MSKSTPNRKGPEGGNPCRSAGYMLVFSVGIWFLYCAVPTCCPVRVGGGEGPGPSERRETPVEFSPRCQAALLRECGDLRDLVEHLPTLLGRVKRGVCVIRRSGSSPHLVEELSASHLPRLGDLIAAYRETTGGAILPQVRLVKSNCIMQTSRVTGTAKTLPDERSIFDVRVEPGDIVVVAPVY